MKNLVNVAVAVAVVLTGMTVISSVVKTTDEPKPVVTAIPIDRQETQTAQVIMPEPVIDVPVIIEPVTDRQVLTEENTVDESVSVHEQAQVQQEQAQEQQSSTATATATASISETSEAYTVSVPYEVTTSRTIVTRQEKEEIETIYPDGHSTIVTEITVTKYYKDSGEVIETTKYMVESAEDGYYLVNGDVYKWCPKTRTYVAWDTEKGDWYRHSKDSQIGSAIFSYDGYDFESSVVED